MNLAIRDIRHSLPRFLLTAIGIGMLLMIVMGMSGIYRGLIEDALLLVDKIGADLWIVQHNTRGPFAEISRIPLKTEDRLCAVPGVKSARAFVSHTIQRERNGKPLRIVVQGLSWPEDKGEWIPITNGRCLSAGHFEMIADQSLGFNLGDQLPLGKNIYTIVGLTRGMVGQGGDGLAFFSLRDAIAIQFDTSGEAIRLERDARRSRAIQQDIGNTQPELLNRAASQNIPALAGPMVSAVIIRTEQGADIDKVAETISGWKDVSVHTADNQKSLLLKGSVDKARRQIGLFRALLVIISAIIMSLILYTLTLDKIHDIAMLKLIGARNSLILGLILQQAIILGGLGYILAFYLGKWIFPLFPRRVIVTGNDLVWLAVIVLAISVLSSLLGIWKAMSVQPNEVL
ncbi:MAG: ABC transporter permease [Desulfobacterales bacterium]|nr:ABC transporter permease [Desulfobacterales bacterium]